MKNLHRWDSQIEILIENEDFSFNEMQSLRAKFDPQLFDSINERMKNLDNGGVIKRGREVVREILKVYNFWGIDVNCIEPGHGVGHLIRDYVNAVNLLSHFEARPADIFVGIVAGILHDAGCAVIERYKESQRAVKHAEAGALLLDKVTRNLGVLSEDERLAIVWSIASHTHYLKQQDVQCSDGIQRKVMPYPDLDREGRPIFGLWLPRWIDRLDSCGPTHVGRHYLTLARRHEDLNSSQGKFYQIDFKSHMNPLLRTESAIKEAGGNRTMLEHLRMYALSQSNSSPYGKHDSGSYIGLRDAVKEMSLRILESSKLPQTFSHEEEQEILNAWDFFLIKNIEPAKNTAAIVKRLRQRFMTLDEATRKAWNNTFLRTMREYSRWAEAQDFEIKGEEESAYSIEGICKDVRTVITPASDYEYIIQKF